MVSIVINLHELKRQVKQALLRRKAELESEWDPQTAAWIAYALLQDSAEFNAQLVEITGNLERWSQDESVWAVGRNLGALCLTTSILQQAGRATPEVIERTLQRIMNTDPDNRFSPLRAPEQVFMVTLLLGHLPVTDSDVKDTVRNIVRNQMKGTPQRQVMMNGAMRELGDTPRLPSFAESAPDVGDAIALVWWYTRYGGPYRKGNKWWKTLDSLLDSISLTDEVAEGDAVQVRVLLPWELAMLYEALAKHTAKPDPSMLFELYPLHPRVKSISESLFLSGEYFNAVLEAAKALNDYLRERTGSHDSEITLVRNVMGDPAAKATNPPIKFNPLDPGSHDYISQQNEQRGLSHLAHGVFFAFRHPKGHEPKDKRWGQIDPYDALDQLITISYLMRRIEGAQ